jgi:hypothetical protein
MPRSYDEYKYTPLWRALASAVKELEVSKELKIETAPEYIIGYIYQELVAKSVVELDALTPDR